MRILFMGTPDFAVVSLRRLVEDGHELCGVFTQPDKPKGRGMKLVFPPVKEYALTQKLPVYQPRTLRSQEAEALVGSLTPELIVVVAYGKLLPEALLSVPPLGAVNVHASLLPRYRGAAPINWAILNGEAETGVSIMYLAPELDAGDVISMARTPIDPEEDAPALWDRLAALGAETLSGVIPALQDGTAARTPQNGAEATYAPLLSRELSPVDWTRPARVLRNQVRGLTPWPCAAAELDGQLCKLHKTAEGRATSAAPGTILSAGKEGIEVACGDGRSLLITQLQGEGGRRMDAASYLCGHPLKL